MPWSEPMKPGNVAVAQSISGVTPTADDVPILSPGQRVRRPFGSIEITTFRRSTSEKEAVFDVEFLVRNESRKAVKIELGDYVRLSADGVPRAPARTTPAYPYSLEVALESAEYASVSFRTRGQPNTIILQFGTGESPRSILRWPN